MIVVGLGNPGKRYEETRHNAGFLVIDAVAGAAGVRLAKALFRPYLMGSLDRGGERQYLVKPLTYMNRSGDVLRAAFRRTGGDPAGLLVVCDNVDLPPGTCRIKLRGSGGGGHRGIDSVERALGHGEFMRLSVGVGRPVPGGDLAAHVLSAPARSEVEAFREGVSRAARAVLDLLEKGPGKVRNELNRRDGLPAR